MYNLLKAQECTLRQRNSIIFCRSSPVENSKTALKYGIKVPNVVRSLIPEHIVLQYLKYCSDVDFLPKESQHAIESSQCMFRIQEEISARFGLFQPPAPKLLTNQE